MAKINDTSVESIFSNADGCLGGIFPLDAVGIALTTPDNTWVSINGTFRTMLGYSHDALAGKTWADITYTDNREEDMRNRAQLIESDSGALSTTTRLIKADGTLLDVNLASTCMNGYTGESYCLTIIEDSTQRSPAHEKLSEIINRYRELFEESNDAIVIHNNRGEIIDVNQRALVMFGYSKEEMLKYSLVDLHPEQELEKNALHFSSMKENPAVRFETLVTRADGEIIPVEINSRLVDPEEGIVQGIFRDTSRQKEQEEALRREKLKTEQAFRAKSAFLKTMSHDLRNPLNAILGMTQLLESSDNGEFSEKQKRFIGNIHITATHLLQVINDILDIADLGDLSQGFKVLKVYPSKVVEGILRVLNAVIIEKQLTIAVHVSNDLVIYSNDKMFMKVVFSLLQLSVKHTDQNGRIAINAGNEGKNLKLVISDTSKGLMYSNGGDHYIVRPEVNIDSLSSEDILAVGLEQTKNIVDLLNAELWVRSSSETGIRFTLYIPLNISEFDINE